MNSDSLPVRAVTCSQRAISRDKLRTSKKTLQRTEVLFPDGAMIQLPSLHPFHEFRGTARSCGRDYGESQAEAIEGFLAMEISPNAKKLLYAGRCWKKLGAWEKGVVEFLEGMAQGSGRSIQEMVLLLLHEEMVHTKNCTGFGATGSGTRDGSAIVGQNWDWSHRLYPWSSLVKIAADSLPTTLTYAYPGLWASAGLNEFGLSLVWTGAGYLPQVGPKVGIPTYALIAGLLACKTCREAVSLLKRTPIAGCFIFFLADAAGEVWLIEGVPGRIEAVQCTDVLSRANHYECVDICRQARQRVPKASLKANTRSRGQRMMELMDKYNGRIDGSVAQAVLRDHGVQPGFDICQHPVRGRSGLTLDSFYALPSKKEFWIARGAPCRHRYERYCL